jgi:hypothetical protein
MDHIKIHPDIREAMLGQKSNLSKAFLDRFKSLESSLGSMLKDEKELFHSVDTTDSLYQMAKMAFSSGKEEELKGIISTCKSTWSSMSVVSALLAGISMAPLLALQSSVGTNGPSDSWGQSWMTAIL